jgi:serine/threonine protein kinase
LKNILVKCKPPESWWVKLCDFGLTRRHGGDLGTLTVRGTPNFMAPETIGPPFIGDPNTANSFLADMWCLGETLFQALTGRSTFLNYQSLLQYQYGAIPFPDHCLRRVHVTQEAANFIRCLMAPNPNGRLDGWQAFRHPWMKFEAETPSDANWLSGPKHPTMIDPAANDYALEQVTQASGQWTKTMAFPTNHTQASGTWTTTVANPNNVIRGPGLDPYGRLGRQSQAERNLPAVPISILNQSGLYGRMPLQIRDERNRKAQREQMAIPSANGLPTSVWGKPDGQIPHSLPPPQFRADPPSQTLSGPLLGPRSNDGMDADKDSSIGSRVPTKKIFMQNQNPHLPKPLYDTFERRRLAKPNLLASFPGPQPNPFYESPRENTEVLESRRSPMKPPVLNREHWNPESMATQSGTETGSSLPATSEFPSPYVHIPFLDFFDKRLSQYGPRLSLRDHFNPFERLRNAATHPSFNRYYAIRLNGGILPAYRTMPIWEPTEEQGAKPYTDMFPTPVVRQPYSRPPPYPNSLVYLQP